jgi:hypothetical protein
MIRYRTERPDVGMPMPAASASMPIPSYDNGLHMPSSAKGTPVIAGMRATVGSPTSTSVGRDAKSRRDARNSMDAGLGISEKK